MEILELINDKRLGKEHSSADIYWLINYLDKIPDYQLSAWLMAVCLNGLTQNETVELTRAMAFSGHVLTLQRHSECSLDGPIKRTRNRGFVDKHSTGGVGDKTSLVLSPLLAALGFKVSKFSGRALGHTGGTVDKLEAIPGFRTNISMKQFETQIEEIGIALGAQTDEFAPADKRLYALRDKTGTVESIPLIAASVMSKKIAGGADHIILDVKVGKGAFMKNLRDAEKLARTMKDIGSKLNLNVQVLLTNMDQPLGATVGNAVEVLEAISVLKGYKNFAAYLADCHPEQFKGVLRCAQDDTSCQFLRRVATQNDEEESDFYKLCIELASTIADRKEVIAALESGEAYTKFIEFVRAQSDADAQLAAGIGVIDKDVDLLIAKANKAKYTIEIKSEQEGYVSVIDAEKIGLAMHQLGYTPKTTGGYDIDNSAGLILYKKVGDKVLKDSLLCTLMAVDEGKLNSVKLFIQEAIQINQARPRLEKLVYKRI